MKTTGKMSELEMMRMVAISTCSFQNSDETIPHRIPPSHEYWTPAYGDVCRAVDREVMERKRSDALAAAKGKLIGIIRNLREIIWNHHSSEVMTPDICPICTDKNSKWVLDDVDFALKNIHPL